MRPNTSDHSPRRHTSRGTKGRSTRNILLAAAVVLLAATVAASATSASSLGRVWGGAASGVAAAVRSLASVTGVLPDKLSSAPSPAALAQQSNGPAAPTRGPVVSTDKLDYSPGETATIKGSGFHPGESVTLQVTHADDTAEGGNGHGAWSVQADDAGGFATTWYVDPDDSHGSLLLVKADCEHGLHADMLFTDASTTYVVNLLDSGWYNTSGHSADNKNYIVGRYAGTIYRNYFVFNLSGVSGTITAVTLKATNPCAVGTPRTYNLYDVSTPLSTLMASNFPGTSIHADLGSGTLLGSAAISLTNASQQSVNFNAAGLAAVQSALGGQFAVGGDYGQVYDEFILGCSSGGPNSSAVQLVITTSTSNSAPNAQAQSVVTDEDTPVAVTLAATDPDANALTYSVVSGPAHGMLSGTAPGLTYTPNLDYYGPDSFTFKANDGQADSNVATVSITVNAVNDAPAISGVPLSQTIDELTPYTLDVDASDVDGPAGSITFSVSGAPAGASLNPSTGVFTWTPSEAQGPGVYNLTFTAKDGLGASSTTSLQLTVNEVNAAPSATCTGFTRNADATGKAAVSAAEVGAGSSDPENDPLTLSLSPAGPFSVGTTIVTLTVTDSHSASSTCSAAITVVDVTPPAISGMPANMTVEATGANGAAASWVAPTATDNVDGPVAVNCVPASGSTFPLGQTTVTCSAADAAGNPSSANFNVTVKDTTAPVISNLPGTGQAFNWVKVNTGGAAPSPRVGHQMVYDSTRNKVILFGGQTTQGALFGGLNLTGQLLNDMWEWDGAKMTWSQVTPTGGPVPSARSFFAMAYDPSRGKVVLYGGKVDAVYYSTSGDTWEWDPATRTWANFTGADTIVYGGLRASQMAYDPNLHQVIIFGGQAYWGGHNGATHAWTGSTWVQKSNTGPFGRIGHAMVTDSARSKVVLFGGYDYLINYPVGGFDPDTWEWDGTSWHQIVAAGPGTRVGVTMAYDAVRHVTVLFGGGNANDTWEWNGTSWSLRSLPDNPSIRLSPGMAFDGTKMVLFGGGQGSGPALGDTWVLQPVASITAEATGPNGATVSWASPTAADTVDGSVPVNCAPASGSTFPLGNTTVTCTSTDARGNTGQATFTVTVQDTTPPALALADVTAAATTPTGAQVSYAASANDSVDGNVPVNCTPASGSTFTIGQTTVQCSAADTRGNTATGSFKVTVTNPAPLAQPLSLTTNEDTAAAVVLNVSDANGDALSYMVVTQPAHGTLNGTAPGLTYMPAANYDGPDSFTYKASDGTTDSNVATVSITVKAVNDAPALAHVGDRSVDEETTLSFTAVGNDDRDTPAPNGLAYTLVGAPVGASINPSTGVFNWTPTEQQGAGSYTFIVRVTDDGSPNLSAEETFTVTVNEVNVAPVIADVPASLTGEWGNPVAFTATATDHDVTQPGDQPNALTFSLLDAPDGATIDPSTGAFNWTPAPAQIGAQSFSVRVTDDGTPSLHHELPVSVTVGKRATSLGYDGDTARKYWETATLSATLRDTGTTQPLAGKTVALGVSSQAAPPAATGADGKAQAGVHLTQDAGAYTATAAFAGDDLYLPSDDSEPFTIEKADQTITWADPAGIVYGTLLSTTQLNASVSVAGTSPAGALTYNPSAGTLLGAGNGQALKVSAAGTHNYNPASKTVHIDVAKATPAVNWNTPAAYTFGVPLSATQLNATAAHPADSGPLAGQALTGTFTYNPAVGVVLPVGNNTLSVVFTPTDSANYTTATKTVTQRVNYAVCALYDQTKAAKSGSTIPVKLTLCDASGHNLSSSNIVVTAVGTRLLSPVAWGQAEDAGNANPDMNFRFTMFDPATPGYIYNLKTTGMATGTYELGFMAGGDPTVYTVQFQIK